MWDCTAYTTWVDGLTAPTDLQQAIIDNYSSYALGVLLSYNEIAGVTINDDQDDVDGDMGDAYAGNAFCMSEAEYDETLDDIVADDDGVTICAIVDYGAEADLFGTANFDKTAWTAVSTSSDRTDTSVTQIRYDGGGSATNALNSGYNDGLVEAGINEFILQPMNDTTLQEFFHVYKSQPRCDADLSSAAVTLAPDFRLDLGDSVIINRADGYASDNAAGLSADRVITLTGESACGDDDDFAVSSVAQATAALVMSLLAISAF